MDRSDVRMIEATNVPRSSGAGFALVFGSQARGTAGPTSDLDIAAWWPTNAPHTWELDISRSCCKWLTKVA